MKGTSMKRLAVLLAALVLPAVISAQVPVGQVITKGDMTFVVLPLATKCPPVLSFCVGIPDAAPGWMVSVSTTDPTVNAFRITAKHAAMTTAVVVNYPHYDWITFVTGVIYSPDPLTSVVVEKMTVTGSQEFD
jgi:hypothetical protein